MCAHGREREGQQAVDEVDMPCLVVRRIHCCPVQSYVICQSVYVDPPAQSSRATLCSVLVCLSAPPSGRLQVHGKYLFRTQNNAALPVHEQA